MSYHDYSKSSELFCTRMTLCTGAVPLTLGRSAAPHAQGFAGQHFHPSRARTMLALCCQVEILPNTSLSQAVPIKKACNNMPNYILL